MPRLLEKIETDRRRLPDWLRRDLAPGHEAARTDVLLKDMGLHTICESGRCPNRNECYSQKTATFMILGDVCTRTCRFCSVSMGKPEIVDKDEPARVADAARQLGLRHVVVTSVNRDDLPDEGVSHFVETIRALRAITPRVTIEVLTPDFKKTQGSAVGAVIDAGVDIFNHNIETVPRLYRRVRPQADYRISLAIFGEIRRRSQQRVLTKSGLMLGLGETRDEVLVVMDDLVQAGCEMLTLGQYLQSSTMGIPVDRYVSPEEFAELKREGFSRGFLSVESSPYVRSSFHAKDSLETIRAVLDSRRAQASPAVKD